MSGAAPDAHRAPVDRTSLSWQRTAMHSAIVAFIAAVASIQPGEAVVAVVAGFVIIVGAAAPRVKRTEVTYRHPWALMVRTVVVLGAAAAVAVMLVVAAALEL